MSVSIRFGGATPGQTITSADSGSVSAYTADAFGHFTVTGPRDVAAALNAGFTVLSTDPAFQNPNLPRNILDGGDFQTNPWQRGTSITGISNTVTYGPDRWFALGGASSSISLVKTANTDIAGFTQACAFQRANANADTAVVNFGQVCESLDCFRLQGLQVTLSFWAKAGATYANGAVTVKLFSGTAADGSAANMVAGSWTGSTTPINGTFTPTTTMTRYTFTGTVPVASQQVGVLFSFTPVGTAGATDLVLFHGVQLETGGAATGYEFKDAEVELALAQRYFFQLNEVNGLNVLTGAPTGTNTQGYTIPLPTPMRVAPTVVVTVGGFKVIVDGAAPAAATGLTAGTAHSNSLISLTSTVTLSAAVHSILLQGSGSTGKITASADY